MLLGVIAGVGLLVVLAAGAFLLLRDGDDHDPVAGDGHTAVDQPAAASSEVRLEPVGAPVTDPFSDPMLAQPEQVPDPAVVPVTAPPAGGTVPASEPGLYGGTRSLATCDVEQLVGFLEANPDKASAWAAVHGIEAGDIRTYVQGLAPVVLTRDTRVTNHGFRDGTANALQSTLQAGTAVLVDATGVPRVKCGCGNPLLPARTLPTTPEYVGTTWDGFDPARVVVVAPAAPMTQLVLVDLGGGSPFVRAVGGGTTDSDLAADELCDLFPEDPSCAASAAPAGEPELLYDIHNIAAVANGPTAPTMATFDTPVTVHSIETYHWNGGQGAAPGTIGLIGPDGATYGPWPVTTTLGTESSPDLYWTAVIPDGGVELSPGSYEIIDSGHDTWAHNDGTGGQGMVKVFGWVTGQAAPPDTGAPAQGDSGADPDREAVELVNSLLTACGLDILSAESLGRGEPEGSWLVEVLEANDVLYYLVFPAEGRVVAQDPVAGEYAAECGFG